MKRRLDFARARGLVLATCMVGCTHPAASPSAPVAAPARTPAPSQSATPIAKGDDPATEGAIAEALAKAAKMRELPATGPVRGVALKRAEMAAHVRATIESEVPASAVSAEGEMLVALGVAPPSFDYMRATVELMSAELAGYYEPNEKTMYLASDLPAMERSATLAHELVHALQDQHYELGKLLEYRSDQSDAQSALHALAEGDATSAMLDQLLESKNAKATDLSDDLISIQVRAAAEFTAKAGREVPEILRRSMIAPYIDGVLFVHWLRRRAGWGEVDRAWRSPPTSTEQLLHPEKYQAHEPPITMAVPLAPDATWPAPEYTDVMGEQSIRVLFEEWLPRVPATSAAAGWGGDRIAVFHAGARIALGWRLRYDTLDMATRANAALLRGVKLQAGDFKRAALRCAERPMLGPFLVAQRDRDIAVVAGPYERAGAVTKSAGTCAQAAPWAARLLSQH